VLLDALIDNKKYRYILSSILVAAAIGWQMNIMNTYRWSWNDQKDFYQQMLWRAPNIEPGTLVLNDSQLITYMGDYPVGFAINTIYANSEQVSDIAYWFESYTERFDGKIDKLLNTTDYTGGKYNAVFSTAALEYIGINYEYGRCLYVLSEDDQHIREFPAAAQELASYSNLDRIFDNGPERDNPFNRFLDGDENSWCYFFQKAELARQGDDWSRVVELWQEAQDRGQAPNNGIEYLPFIEGFAHQNDWEQALAMTKRANQLTGAMEEVLCVTWSRIESETTPIPQRDQSIDWVNDRFGCNF
jgi:hypothetical protein